MTLPITIIPVEELAAKLSKYQEGCGDRFGNDDCPCCADSLCADCTTMGQALACIGEASAMIFDLDERLTILIDNRPEIARYAKLVQGLRHILKCEERLDNLGGQPREEATPDPGELSLSAPGGAPVEADPNSPEDPHEEGENEDGGLLPSGSPQIGLCDREEGLVAGDSNVLHDKGGPE